MRVSMELRPFDIRAVALLRKSVNMAAPPAANRNARERNHVFYKAGYATYISSLAECGASVYIVHPIQ